MRRGGRRGWSWAAALAASALGVVLVSDARAPAAAPVRIDIAEFRYAPPVLTIAAGTAVTWTNHDEETHTVTAASGAFASSGLESEESFTQTFTSPGTYPYYCALHPRMKATVVVR